jgi:hypothetical protein
VIFTSVSIVGESQIYRDLMRFRPEDLSANAWAVKAGVSRTVWADMRRHGNPSRRTLEKLLSAAGSSLAEFEALRLGPEPRQFGTSAAAGHIGDARQAWRPAPLRPLPFIASTLLGEWRKSSSQVELTELRPREVLDQLPRPSSLAGDSEAFAFTIVGDSMSPRFRPGSRVAVSPRSPVAIGDEILARLRYAAAGSHNDAQQVLIMHLVRRTTKTFELRQFNPDMTVEIDADEVESTFKIVGELI